KKRPERMAFFTEKWYSVLRQSWFLTTDPHSPDNRTVRPKQALLFFGMTGLCFVCTGIRRTSTSFPTSGTIIEKGSQPVQGCRQNQNRGEMELCLQQSDMCVLPHCRRHWNSTGNAAARSWAEAVGCVWAGSASPRSLI